MNEIKDLGRSGRTSKIFSSFMACMFSLILLSCLSVQAEAQTGISAGETEKAADSGAAFYAVGSNMEYNKAIADSGQSVKVQDYRKADNKQKGRPGDRDDEKPGKRPDDKPKKPDNGPGRPDDRPKKPDDGPRRPDDKRPDDKPRRPDDGPKRPDDKPKKPDDGPRRPDDKRPDDKPKKPNDGPKRPDDGPRRPDDKKPGSQPWRPDYNGNDGKHNTKEPGRYIDSDEAKRIAFRHAGVSSRNIENLKVSLNRDKHLYKIEFSHRNKWYGYEISAVTGKILKHYAK